MMSLTLFTEPDGQVGDLHILSLQSMILIYSALYNGNFPGIDSQ